MKVLSAIGGGLAGACALTLLHEITRRIDKDAPRMDLLGREAIAQGLRFAGQNPPDSDKLQKVTLLGDILSNTLYYSLAAAGHKKYVMPKGTVLGLVAGLGALFLPKPMGLNPAHSNRTLKTQVLTTSFYLVGGLVASLVAKKLEKKSEKNEKWNKKLNRLNLQRYKSLGAS